MVKLKLGLSACLAGEKTRFDGDDRFDRFLVEALGKHVVFFTVCPEVEAGFGIPREPMRLEGNHQALRLISEKTRRDLTEILAGWAQNRVAELSSENLSGFIFKSRSPSCGPRGVKIYGSANRFQRAGVGLFAHRFQESFPLLPIQEEDLLHDFAALSDFLDQVLVLGRWRDLLNGYQEAADLIAFHTFHKMIFLAHSPVLYRELGRVASAADDSPARFTQYQGLMIQALRRRTTRGKHANVLQHALGYFKKELSARQRQQILKAIEAYRTGKVPLALPLNMIVGCVDACGQMYLKNQYYLQRQPVEIEIFNRTP